MHAESRSRARTTHCEH